MPAELIAIDSVHLACEQWGRGASLICLHGGMGVDSAYLKVPGLLGLAGDRRRLVIYDQRGHGGSDRATPQGYSRGLWVEDLRALAAQVVASPFALLGHSYGGFIALEFAVRHCSALSHLILVGT